LTNQILKGTVSRDFRPSVFFINPWSHWNRGSRPFQTNISNFLANLKPYAKQLSPWIRSL
jgi:hypothetical protein